MAWKMIELNDGPIVWFYKKNSLRTGNHGLFCQMISLVLNMVISHSNMLDYERIYGTNLLSLVVWFISILTICFRCALHIGHGTEKKGSI